MNLTTSGQKGGECLIVKKSNLELLKMMIRAQAKHQYQYVVNLIIVLERFMDIKNDLQEILQITMDTTRHV